MRNVDGEAFGCTYMGSCFMIGMVIGHGIDMGWTYSRARQIRIYWMFTAMYRTEGVFLSTQG